MKGLIANNIWPQRCFIHTKECTNNEKPVDSVDIVLEDFLSGVKFPNSVQEKLDNLLQMLYKLQNVDGERILVKNTVDGLWVKGYFKTPQELMQYIQGLDEDGLIKHLPNGNEPLNTAIKFTMKGLKEVSKRENTLQPETKDCFIAMAFDERTKPFRRSYKESNFV
ncbi:MAG: hypothetical protein IPP51_18520 [Bacteroidetes bacterium]|nr:hypothetical protein [Bacteroidota bacterium]